MKKLTALLLIFALLLALSACASPQNEKTEDGSGKTEETDKTEAVGDNITGVYKFREVDGVPLLDYMKANVEGDLDTFLEGFGLTQETVDEFMTITLNEDGTYTSSNVHLEEPSEGTWRLDGDKVIITGNNGNETELTYEDGCLIIEQENGEVWKFAK